MENRIRSDYTKSLQDLQDGLLILGSMVEKAIHKSMQSLKERDLQLAQTVIAEDDLKYLDFDFFRAAILHFLLIVAHGPVSWGSKC